MNDCLFCRIIAGEIPADIVTSTADAVVIRDVNPQAPTHVLVLPRRHVAHLSEFVAAANDGEAARLFALASQAGAAADPDGYRVVINEGKHGGQTVYHLHLHVLAGRQMHWPPG